MAGAAAMTFGAAYIRGLTGFGMAIILVPLLGSIVTPGEAVGATVAVGAAIAAGVMPAAGAARTSPAEALRRDQ